jgi:aspartokinase-like uncharacterized kinase
MAWPSVVVKVGGSLYDMPDLATRLRRFLETLPVAEVLLVPGGGPTADVVRALDERHQLSEEKAHWLALRALTFNAHFLADLLAGGRVVQALDDSTTSPERPAILDPFAFARWDEEAHPNACLPPCWDATSDSLAARVAVVAGASRLCLLKSAPPRNCNLEWLEPEYGYVDRLFKAVLAGSRHRLLVEAVDLRGPG